MAAATLNDTAADLDRRRSTAKDIRALANDASNQRPFPHHPTNEDEDTLTPSYIGNFYKGLPQDQNGVVDVDAYKKLLKALESGDPADFELIPLGRIPPGPAATILQNFAEVRVERINGVDSLISNQRFFRTTAQFDEMMAAASTPEPRFYRLHSEAAATADGKALLINPQAALGYDLEGSDSHAFKLSPPPSYGKTEIVAEIAENYWMALLRDIPFVDYEDTSNAIVNKAINHLNSFDAEDLKVPRDPVTKRITGKTLFRGTAAGDLVGPYVSQFLLRDIPFGGYLVEQKVKVGYEKLNDAQGKPYDQVFLNNAQDWYTSQLGLYLSKVKFDEKAMLYNYRARELCNYVHIDELFQGYLNAELIMSVAPPPDRQGMGVPLSPLNPYSKSETQVGFGTLGEPNFSSLIAEVATRALKAVWFQKWGVHRRLRPEAFAGHIHFYKTSGGNIRYPFTPKILSMLDPVLSEVKAFNAARNGDGFFLPMAFRDGCPLHPAYGAGHATVAGACVSLLKAFYRDDITFGALNAQTIYVPKRDGTLWELSARSKTATGCPYTFDDLKDKMTVGGELDKLASNVSLARNFSGVHWRSDHAASLRLGEQIASRFLQQVASTYNEDVGFSFKGFDGQAIVISKY